MNRARSSWVFLLSYYLLQIIFVHQCDVYVKGLPVAPDRKCDRVADAETFDVDVTLVDENDLK